MLNGAAHQFFPTRARALAPCVALGLALAGAQPASAETPGGLPNDDASSLVLEHATARDPRSARVLYREQHWLRRDRAGRPLERVVVYRCPAPASGAPAFARKRLDYRTAALAPRFSFEDARSGYREGLRAGATPRLFVRVRGGAAERSAALPGAGVVVDAGFDEFVRAHWDALVAGRTLPLEFALPSRLRSYRFEVVRVGDRARDGDGSGAAARSAATTVGPPDTAEPQLHLRLQLDGWLAWVAPAIDVRYGLRSRRLLRFDGPGTIRDAAGEKPLTARIQFEGAATPASEGDWRAALAIPLSGCGAGRGPDTAKANTDSAGQVAST